MKVMLDTNICIYLNKQQPPAVIERFRSHQVGEVGVSTITVAELACGVSKSRHQAKNRLALDQFLGPLDVATFAQDAALVYGKLPRAARTEGLTSWFYGSAHRSPCSESGSSARHQQPSGVPTSAGTSNGKLGVVNGPGSPAKLNAFSRPYEVLMSAESDETATEQPRSPSAIRTAKTGLSN